MGFTDLNKKRMMLVILFLFAKIKLSLKGSRKNIKKIKVGMLYAIIFML